MAFIKEKQQKINQTKIWVFEKINEIDKPQAHPSKKKRERHKLPISEMKEKLPQAPRTLKAKQWTNTNNSMTSNLFT